MNFLHFALGASILLCGLVAGLVFTFAVIIMPGIQTLQDREFLKAFKKMDGIIQNNDPRFVVVWLGSILFILLLSVQGIRQLEGTDRHLLIAATIIYLAGVQWPTFRINIPLNNRIQQSDLEAMTAEELRSFRQAFESRWTLWNTIRTFPAILTVILLVVLAIRL